MPITDLLEQNAEKYATEVALVEVNPQIVEKPRMLWKDYDLIQPTSSLWYRREITWSVFNEKANRFAQLLISRGVKKGDKVAILLMNCLEWLPIYFGVLKTGALAVPMNFRYSAEEIKKLFDVSAVSLPANDATEISARSYCDGVIAELTEERRKAEQSKKYTNTLKLLLEVNEHENR